MDLASSMVTTRRSRVPAGVFSKGVSNPGDSVRPRTEDKGSSPPAGVGRVEEEQCATYC